MTSKILIGVTVLMAVFLVVSAGTGARTKGQLKAVEQELADLRATNVDLKKKLNDRDTELKVLHEEKAKLKDAVDSVRSENSRKIAEIESRFRNQLQQMEVQITRKNDALTLEIDNRVLFDSGKVVIKPDGQEILNKIAETINTSDQFALRIEGHTDDVPTQHSFDSNWELSTARACSAIRYLINDGAVSGYLLAAVGYGDTRPLVPNVDDESRAQNRRIEVIVVPRNQSPFPATAPEPADAE